MSELSSSTDADLVAAISRRDGRALAESYDRHGNAVFGLAWRVLRCNEHAQDVVQEVFMRLWEHPHRFDPHRGGLRSFLLAQAHGQAVDLVRSESSRARREERCLRAGQEDPYDLEAQVVAEDARRPVLVALAALTPSERRAIGLAYFGGFTYVDVAHILEQPEGTIKSRIRSGLRRMRIELDRASQGEQ